MKMLSLLVYSLVVLAGHPAFVVASDPYSAGDADLGTDLRKAYPSLHDPQFVAQTCTYGPVKISDMSSAQYWFFADPENPGRWASISADKQRAAAKWYASALTFALTDDQSPALAQYKKWEPKKTGIGFRGGDWHRVSKEFDLLNIGFPEPFPLAEELANGTFLPPSTLVRFIQFADGGGRPDRSLRPTLERSLNGKGFGHSHILSVASGKSGGAGPGAPSGSPSGSTEPGGAPPPSDKSPSGSSDPGASSDKSPSKMCCMLAVAGGILGGVLIIVVVVLVLCCASRGGRDQREGDSGSAEI